MVEVVDTAEVVVMGVVAADMSAVVDMWAEAVVIAVARSVGAIAAALFREHPRCVLPPCEHHRWQREVVATSPALAVSSRAELPWVECRTELRSQHVQQ